MEYTRRLTANRLNDDGVVALLLAIFIGQDYRGNLSSDKDPMEFWFGGGVQVGNSHNGAYNLGIQMAKNKIHKCTGL